MSIQNWSDDIMVVELGDDPAFTEDLTTVVDEMERAPRNVVLNFGAVGFLNSSNIAKLLKLRKILITAERRLVLCGVNTQVWGVFLVTGLEKIFECTGDTSTALATLQLALGGKERS